MKGLACETNKCDASTYFANNNIYLHTAAGGNFSCTGLCLDTLEFALISVTVCGIMLVIGLGAGTVWGCCYHKFHRAPDDSESNSNEQELNGADDSVIRRRISDSPVN